MEDNVWKNNGSWICVKISDIGNIVTGKTPSTKKPEYYGEDFPFYKPADLNFGFHVTNAKNHISDLGLEKTHYLPESSTLVTSIGATIGKTGFIRKAGASNQQINAIVPFNGIYPEYVYFVCISPQFQKHILENASATTLPIINKSKFSELPFPLAPYNEQIRIASKIEELFSRLDQVVKTFQQAQQQFEQYRQSLFNDLFSSKFDIYHKVTIRTILEPSKKRFNPLHNKETAYIGLADIESNTGKILKIGKSSETKSLKSVFHSEDLLYGKLRPYLNKVAVPNFDGVCSTDIIVFKSSDKINHNYLQYALMSNDYVSYATKNMRGVQLPRINFDEMAKFIIPYPPLEVQNKIHIDYEKRLSIINDIVFNIEQTKFQSELLRQLILIKAFEGCLVPQDVNDEPASVLLEHIKAEKVKLEVSRKKGKFRGES